MLGFFVNTFGLLNSTKAEIIQTFCIIKNSDLVQAKIENSDISRIVGKQIHLVIDYENKVLSDYSIDGVTSLITGIYDASEIVEFNKSSSGISYNTEMKVLDEDDKIITYSYSNQIYLNNNKPIKIRVLVNQTGISFNNWKFIFECRDNKYSNTELAEAKEPDWLKRRKKSINSLQKERIDEIIKSYQ